MEKLLKFTLTVLLLVSFRQLPAQATITLSPVYDAAIGFHDGHNTANNNDGGAEHFAAYCVPAAGYPGVNVVRSLMNFDLSLIPVGVQIVSAELDLYSMNPYGNLPGHTGTANECYLQRIIQPWTEYGVTWNNQPNTSTQNQVILPLSSSPAQDYLNINVTGLVGDMYAAQSTSFGFLMKMVIQQQTNLMGFCSTDHTNTALHPKLRVSFKSDASSGIPDPGTVGTPTYFGPGGVLQVIALDGSLVESIPVTTADEMDLFKSWELKRGIYFMRYIIGGQQKMSEKIFITH